MYSVRYLVLFASVMLSACSPLLKSVGNMYRDSSLGNKADQLVQQPLQPQYKYLEVHSAQQQALLVLAFQDQPDGQPAIQTWFDADSLPFRIQGNRVLTARAGQAPVPNSQYTWASNPAEASAPWLPTARTVEQPAAQLHGQTFTLQSTAVPLAQVRFNSNLLQRVQPQAAQLQWFVEAPGTLALQPGLYAYTAQGLPVYGFQCVAPTQCFEWLYRN